MGEVLAEATIQPDRKVLFLLDKPLEKDHRLGITYSDLSGTIWTQENFNDQGFNGELPRLIPQVGFFFDTVLVTSR
jgi:hypothetical protein